MTTKNILVFVALLVVIVLWESLSDLIFSYPITNFPPQNQAVLVWGDSLSSGVGASSPEHGYVAELARRLPVTFINISSSGETSKDVLSHAAEDLASTTASTTMIFIGGNDVLQGVPSAETLANVERLIALAQEHNMVVYLIGFQKHADDAYARGLEKIAKETGSLYTPDVLGDIIGNPALMSDEVHPNDKGYLKIADKIAPTLEGVVLSATSITKGNTQ